ncbi:isocitrate lyase/PEP mutase family protein [Ponticaulis sp.]|uniref:isocitrate lyase/PEP mutase family protein n=1 Tax=Ponticaulis sp. TaxID=2020902 RepID=UPI000B6319D1|nr:isocitrate lyase/PEP mutase family protein [Ponticaulis sp.]MAI91272.1 carboxyvinyl-carboxyphosphonate phosphorylmutase [Ponticaulis sp.]OUX98581.1 MAG: carboxyvinyl-carboxyphosphonate phosphorylmutase [Hyphomonadaceae bacterium TMED5]|tara:strand:+ start:2497 stop:3357 length:861 start_codon:yes stop_codon:yes gene_type:complete
MADPILRQKLAENGCLIVPGLQDMIAAKIANKVGFPVVFGSGYWLTASAMGLPDVGLATYSDMLKSMQTLVDVCDGALIADADTGYGGLLNIQHTVRGYERAGVTAIQLEDQEFPKRCGHTPGKRIVPDADMADRVRVAADTREDKENFLIIARTDARQSEGLDGVLRRLDAYAEAGADILFPEALASEDEMVKVCERFDLPLMINMANGGSTPMMTAREIEEIGYSIAIFPSLTSLVAARAMEDALRTLKETGNGDPDEIFSFKELGSMLGFDEVHAFERKWARD